MKFTHRSLITFTLGLGIFLVGGCPNENGSDASQSSHSHEADRGEHDHEHAESERGEHDRDAEEHSGEAGEESGTELSLNAIYNETRNGARLVLSYDQENNAFRGAVVNTTDKTLERVRVEVHLSNGRELGPTAPADLAPGEKRDVTLVATSKDFDGWSAHPEVGSGEHGHGEGQGEHGSGEGSGEPRRGEGRGEHN